ncbi:MAG: DUF1501 domain-containing protein [Gemmataceae bacterium]|nr:DUF1501 domain-containing protein [Gemmataceae bacterium]
MFGFSRRSEGLSRRDWLKLSALGVCSASVSGWLPALANETAQNSQRRKSCILLWMNGGASQLDTFDPKPGTPNGGPVKVIDTNVEGIQIAEHFPKLAKFMDKMAIIRSMNTGPGQNADHGQETFQVHTGYQPRGAIQYPSLGSLVAKEIGTDESALPNYVNIAPFRQFNADAAGAGFLGPKYAPLMVAETNYYQQQNANDYDKMLKVQDLAPFTDLVKERFDARIGLLQDLEKDFVTSRPGVAAKSHATAYERAVKLMQTAAAKAFNLEEEDAKNRDRYGRTLFGQGCLLARRLVEQHVPFIEVTLGQFGGNQLGWDTHQNNFEAVKRLSGELDLAWSSLMEDLKERGLLDSTLIVWASEFGRTPKITPNSNGREHWASGWSTVLAGGGIKGGQVIGNTGKDGMKIEERPVTAPDFIATVVKALGIDPKKQNMSNVDRPIRIADPKADPINELIA